MNIHIHLDKSILIKLWEVKLQNMHLCFLKMSKFTHFLGGPNGPKIRGRRTETDVKDRALLAYIYVSVDCLSDLSQIIVYICQKLNLTYAFKVRLMWVWLLKMPTQNIVHIVGDVKVSIEESLGDCFVTAKNLVWQQLFHSAFHQIGLWIYCTCTVNKEVWSHTNQ